jgi:hypothetical protein
MLAAFTIEVSNLNSLKTNETYTEWGFEDNSSAALHFGSDWFGRQPGSWGFYNSSELGKDIIGVGVGGYCHQPIMCWRYKGKAIVRMIVRIIITRELVSCDQPTTLIIRAIRFARLLE